ncbi:MAG: hypothetical protein WCS42_08650 [Verrucomicrobiota bacterium]
MKEITLELQRRIEALEARQNAEVDPRLAWKLKDGAALIGISYRKFRNEVLRRKIVPTASNLITKKELLRYLDEQQKIGDRKAFGNTRREMP